MPPLPPAGPARPPTASPGPLVTDAALVEAVRAGDPFAFAALYDRYKGPVYGYCARMLLDREAAQDAVQETFARAFEHRARLVASASFKAWIFTIARNQCLNLLRRSGRETGFTADAPEPVSPGATPFAALLRSEQADLLARALAALSPASREVVVLREDHDLSYDEIAALTRTTVSAVKSRLFKARRQIAAALRPLLRPETMPAPADVR